MALWACPSFYLEALIKVLRHRIRYDPGDEFNLFFLTDFHLGHALCNEDLLKNDIAEIGEDPKALWIGGGDYAEFINRGDKRHRESSLASWLHGKDDIIAAQEQRLLEYLLPIKDKCLGLVVGTHEAQILDRSERDVYSSLVNSLTGKDRHIRLGVQGFIVLMWDLDKKNRWKTTLFVHHGSGGGLLPGGHALTLGRLPTWFEFDIALIGHRHTRQWVPNTITGPNTKSTGVKQREQAMLFGGTYLESIAMDNSEAESYAEYKMLPPKAAGGVRIKFKPSKQQYKITF